MNDSAPNFSHVDASGRPGMVDVSQKQVTVRRALAEAVVRFPAGILSQFQDSEWQSKKGPVWHTAIIAGTQAVKRTSDWLPFCHPLPVEGCHFAFEEQDDGLRITCEVSTSYKTGVEMEALTGVSAAALTIIDMCKSASPRICIEHTRLLEKTGGKSDLNVS